MVDLAGSEKMNVAKDAPTMSKRHLQELTSINKSLSCLGNVIAVLADKSSGKIPASSHVPYRDSKLTRLLQDSLGGSTRTVVIACVCPASQHGPESISTLKFADRARRVMARICANEVVDDSTLLARAKLEIKRLQRIINMLRAREGERGDRGGSMIEGDRSDTHNEYNNGGSHTYEHNNPVQSDRDDIDRDDGGGGGGGDVYTRQLRIENLKLKDENRKLKDKCRKMKSKRSILSSSDYPSTSSTLDPALGYLNYNDAKNVNMGKKKYSGREGGVRRDSDDSSLVLKLGLRVENLEMKRRLENEFNNPLLPPKLTPFINQHQHEYESHKSGDEGDEDGDLGIDMQINILKSMNSKIESNSISNLEDEDDEEGGEGDEYNTDKEVKMLDMLMSTHKQLRLSLIHI